MEHPDPYAARLTGVGAHAIPEVVDPLLRKRGLIAA